MVTCLFSAVGYMTTEADLDAAVANMAQHVRPGGVLLVEGWITPDAFLPGPRVGAQRGQRRRGGGAGDGEPAGG